MPDDPFAAACTSRTSISHAVAQYCRWHARAARQACKPLLHHVVHARSLPSLRSGTAASRAGVVPRCAARTPGAACATAGFPSSSLISEPPARCARWPSGCLCWLQGWRIGWPSHLQGLRSHKAGGPIWTVSLKVSHFLMACWLLHSCPSLSSCAGVPRAGSMASLPATQPSVS